MPAKPTRLAEILRAAGVESQLELLLLNRLPLPERQALVARIGADLALVERVTTQVAWLSFRLHGAWSNR